MTENNFEFEVWSLSLNGVYLIRQILDKKWEYNEAVYPFFINLKKSYNSVRWGGIT
jgi:hypothetical protein